MSEFEQVGEESKRQRFFAELDALTEMMVRDTIIQDHLIAEEVKNVRARLAAQQPEEPAQADTKERAEMSSKYTETEIPHRYKVLSYGYTEDSPILVVDSGQDGKTVTVSLDEYEAQVERDVAEYWESKSEEPAQVSYPLTSETMYSATPNGGTTICNTCGVPVGYDGLVPPVLCYRCSQTESTSKVEALAANLKHLDKPGRRETPRRTDGFSIAFAMAVQGGWWGRKVYAGRNKGGAKVTHFVNDIFVYDNAGDARLSPSALLHWFPVALENTTYHDAIALHFSQYSQEGLRATRGFLEDGCLFRKYQWWGWQSSAVYGNKAQVNRYHALKTS